MSNSFDRIKGSKFISGLLKNKSLQIGLLIFSLLSASVILTSLFIPAKTGLKKDNEIAPSETSTKKEPKIAELEDSIKKARSITSPLAREAFIQDEARRLGKTSDEYRRLYTLSTEIAEIALLEKSIKKARSITSPLAREAFIQNEARGFSKTSDEYKRLYTLSKESLNSIPDAPKNPFYIIGWYYLDLNPHQRFQILGNGIPWLINLLSGSAIFLVAVRYILEIPEREKQAKYQAWQVIHTAYGQKSSGARIAALEDLLTQQESLRGLSLEEGANLRGAILTGADLRVADLRDADLTGAILTGADLRDADLTGANLNRAILTNADLRDADLRVALLRNADLTGADLRVALLRNSVLVDADLTGADLRDADLRDADLTSALLRNADLRDADLTGANLTGANLTGANLTGANLIGANLIGAKNLLPKQIKSANNWRKALYDGKPLNDPENIKKLGLDDGKTPLELGDH